MTLLHIVALTVFGSLLNRWRGCGHPLKKFTPRPVCQIALSIPFALYVASGAYVAAVFGFYDDLNPLAVAVIVGSVIAAVTTLGWITGHGQYFPDTNPQQLDSPQAVDFIVSWFFGKDPRVFDHPAGGLERYMMLKDYGLDRLRRRCFFGMALTGLCVTMPAGLATADPLLALSGVLKAPCYTLAHRLGWGTEGGEYLTGAVFFLTLGISWSSE